MLLKSVGSQSAAMSVEHTRSSSSDSVHRPSAEQTVGAFVYMHVRAGEDKIVLTCVAGCLVCVLQDLKLKCEGVVVKNKQTHFFSLLVF